MSSILRLSLFRDSVYLGTVIIFEDVIVSGRFGMKKCLIIRYVQLSSDLTNSYKRELKVEITNW